MSARRRWIDIGLTSFTYLVLLVMLAPVLWLVASSLQPNGNLANGEYDLLHPTLDAFDYVKFQAHYQQRYPGAMYSGCGGGYMIVASEEPVEGAFKIKIRREDPR